MPKGYRTVRMYHPVLRSCMYVVEMGTPYASGKPRHCNTCKKEHMEKSLHLRIDSSGHTMVSASTPPSTFAKLELAGLEYANPLDNAPTQKIGAVEQPSLEVVERHASGREERFNLPAVGKYESEAATLRALDPLIQQMTKLAEAMEQIKAHEIGRKIFDMAESKER